MPTCRVDWPQAWRVIASRYPPINLFERLTADAAGNLYGTTYYGGASDVGTVFALALDGTKTILHSFSTGEDGANPGFSGPLTNKNSYLYGTTPQGGAHSAGVVFKVKK